MIERAELKGEFDYGVRAYRKEARLRLRYLDRIALGTAYPEVVARVVEVTGNAQLAGQCHLAVDGTGVGRPVVDLLRAARSRAILMPVTITGGQTELTGQGFYRVPKRDLIVGLQVLLQRGGLEIAAGLPYVREMMEEMMAMEVRVSPAGNEQYAAWREGQHDDLVFALALAYWSAQKAYPGPARGSEQWWVDACREDAERMFRKFMWEEEGRNGHE